MTDDREAAFMAGFQRDVLSRRQALHCGLTDEQIEYRIRPGGPWRRLLPGVYLTTTGTATREQLLTAAVIYAGWQSVVTGLAALPVYGIKAAAPKRVDVLVPYSRKRMSRTFVAIHRTGRLPAPGARDLAIAFAPAARAVVDAARGLQRRSDVRAVVAGAVQRGRCGIADLAAELAAGPVRGSALTRVVLGEVADGIRSPAEGDFRVLVLRSGLPVPLFNSALYLNGGFLAVVDAWWPEVGVAAEVDSREWHLSPESWEATMDRHRRLAAAGIRTLHVSPREVRESPEKIVRQIAAALSTGSAVAGVTVRPAAV